MACALATAAVLDGLAHDAQAEGTVRRRTFVTRLEQASDWTPELPEYAISYLLGQTDRVSIYQVLDAAGLGNRSQSTFKTDNVRLTGPRSSVHLL